MDNLMVLPHVELVPVIEIPPGVFSSELALLPGEGQDFAWKKDGCWPDALAEMEVGLKCSMDGLTDPVALKKLVAVLLAKPLATAESTAEGPSPAADRSYKRLLGDGLEFYCGEDLLVAPGCCAGLDDLTSWREAASYRGTEWQMVWIGHPWISVRFHEGWLILSEPHESENPVARWAVKPEELERAVAAAQAELEDFARRLQPAVEALGVGNAAAVARRLAGLSSGSVC